MTQPDAVFRALAEPNRRTILRLVRDRPLSVGDVAAGLPGITQQAVSQHLTVLKEAGLVTMEKQGQRRLYLVRPEGLESIDAFLRAFWPDSLDRLKDVVEHP